VKINLYKSKVVYFGKVKEVEDQYRELFACESGSIAFRYIGIPIHFTKFKNGQSKPMEVRFKKKLSNWIGKLLSYGDHPVLTKLIY
jgi:hypothetical protein